MTTLIWTDSFQTLGTESRAFWLRLMMLKLLIPFLVIASSTLAQVHPHVRDFVPKGWEIERALKVDLTNDGLPDEAMVIIERIGKNNLDENLYDGRTLLVLKNTGKGFELIGKNDRVLWSANVQEEAVAIDKGDSSALNLKFKRGNLILHEFAHFGIHSDASEFTFRYDPKNNRMQEIGADSYNFERDGYGEDNTSINFITGVMIKEKSIVDEDEWPIRATDKTKTSRKRIPKQLIWMEDAVEADEM